MIEVNQINNTEFDLKITTEGIYYITYTATDSQGRQYTDAIAIAAISRDAIDNLLKGKWGLMKAALGSGEIENALIHIASGSKDMYRYNFTLMSSILPTIAQDMGNITLIKIEDNLAEYEMTATQGGQTLSFYVEFIRDIDGIWRIRFY